MLRYVDPEDMVHPLRKQYPFNELPSELVGRVIDAIADTDFDDDASVNHALDSVTDEELEAFNDQLFDSLASNLQTVPGVTSLQ